MSFQAYASSPSSNFVEQAGQFFFRYRNVIVPFIFLGTVLFFKPTFTESQPLLDQALNWTGALLVILGDTFRLLVIGLAYIHRGGKNGKVYAQELVTTGFYAHSRNPMYLGNGLIAVGLPLAWGSVPACLLTIPFFIFVYYSIMVAEETFLRKEFGREYELYEAGVPRFIPRFRGLRQTLSEFDFDWRKSLRKEYGTLFSTLSGLLFIFAFKDIYSRTHTFSLSLFAHSWYSVCGIVLLVCYIVVRTLKKQKLL